MDHCNQGKLNIPRKPQHGLNFEYMRDTIRTTESKAALAVVNAFEKALEAVLVKHEKRGDSWEETFSTSTCFNLAGAKIKRVEILLDMHSQSLLTPDDVTDSGEITKEMDEEATDAIAYIAFGMWMLGKL